MIKMATMPIYGKNPLKFFFSGTTGQISTKLGMKHWGLEYYNVFYKLLPLDDLYLFLRQGQQWFPIHLNWKNC